MIVSLITTTAQDIKAHSIWWFLPLVSAACGFFLFYNNSIDGLLAWNILANASVLALILGICFIYYRIVKPNQKLPDAIGFGDLLFFMVFAVGFPTLTFIVLFSSSLILAFFIHLAIKGYRNATPVPLAGYQALFLCIVYLAYWLNFSPSLYYL